MLKAVTLTLCGCSLLLQSCSSAPRFTDNPSVAQANRHDPKSDFYVGQTWIGQASFYGKEHDGKKTASGEIFDMNGVTAAHKYLPFGTVVRVENLLNEKTCEMPINDRGPWVPGRVIDLSYGAAKEIGLVGVGVTDVRITIVKLGVK